MPIKKIILFFLLIATVPLFSQNITLNGSVYGFIGEKMLLLKKASKNVSFEGPISGVKISVSGDKTNVSVVTGIDGNFSFSIPQKGKYSVSIAKQGYSTVNFDLNYEDAGNKTNYIALSFILKKDDAGIDNIGEILIHDKGKLTLANYDENQKKASADVLQSNKVLIEKTIVINNSSANNVYGSVKKAEVSPKKTEEKVAETIPTVVDSTHKKIEQSVDSIINSINLESLISVEDLRDRLEEAKKHLSQMSTSDANYINLQKQIRYAENQLKMKEELIESQQKEIGASKKVILYLSLFVVVVVVSLLMALYFLREKKKSSLELNNVNKKISKINSRLMSSMRYAAIIQGSMFKDRNELLNIFPESFIINQPKDFLSGDFYWFGKKNGHKIVVVADCTGHGIPGALLTMLGYHLLEDIINVKGEVLPSKIILELNKAILNVFSKQTSIEYGVDLSIVSIEENTNQLFFSGITNGIYHYSNAELKQYKVTPKTIGSNLMETDVVDQKISFNKGDCFYLMSDGYSDQFGGKSEKIEKYNVKRLEAMLIETSGNFSTAETKLAEEFTAWKGEKEQTDDVLLLGFKL